jgi:microcystin-dependent protein
MSFFTYSSHSIYPPVGSVIPYVGGGTTDSSGNNPGDPDGWVICDGKNRISTDGRYATLAGILNTYNGVSNNTSNSIYPPNLQNCFIYGNTSASTTSKSSGGSSTCTLTSNNIPSHTHTVNGTVAINYWGAAGGSELSPYTVNSGSGTKYLPFSTTSDNNTTTNASFSILPPYVTMNYIMKY